MLGGKDVKKERHAVFFTAVMFMDHHRERYYDVTKPRIAVLETHLEIHQNSLLEDFEGCSE